MATTDREALIYKAKGWSGWIKEGNAPMAIAEVVDGLVAALAAPPVEQQAAAVMVDCVPPATSRDKWFYEQGRLAERDARTHAMESSQPAPQAGAARTHDDLDDSDLDDLVTLLGRHEREEIGHRGLIAAIVARFPVAATTTEQPSQDAERLDFLDAFLRQAGGGVSLSGAGPVRQIIDAARAAQAQGEKGGA